MVKAAKKAGIHSEEEDDDDDYYVGVDAIPIEAERPLEVEASELYCICNSENTNVPMVQCEQCSKWYHCECVNFIFNSDTGNADEPDYFCAHCLSISS